ncbi:hypothetical protein HYV71_02605 [Candidatus Uhrbacteria bacterium]|nr:hypothetical protein [Candidatus Uhrbacteria bacterium]
MSILLKLTKIRYAGKSIGRDIRVEIEASGSSLKIEKRIPHGSITTFNDAIGIFDKAETRFEADVKIKITETDLIFSDTGEKIARLFVDDTHVLPKSFQYTVSIQERRMVFWKVTAVFTVTLEASLVDEKHTIEIKKYRSYGKEDYNHYDAIFSEVVNYWNNEFLNDTNPPTELLDPNLIKAIAFQETRIGHDPKNNGLVDIMQVGNPSDPALKTLRGELPEYWIHHEMQIPLRYNAKIESVRESIHWGVRWLYHKSQGITSDNRRTWRGWRNAVHRYGPGKQSYTEDVWRIYTKGTKKEKNGTIIILWTLTILLLILALSLIRQNTTDVAHAAVLKTFHTSAWPADDVIVQFSKKDSALFWSILEVEEDWSEDFHVGRLNGREVTWLSNAHPPSEQSILSARFISLNGFSGSVIEVYGETHQGHGNLYLYRVEGNTVHLFFQTEAVDSYNEHIWRPSGYPEYGFHSCGERYNGGKLRAHYRDLNGDGIDDMLLNGSVEVFCEDIVRNMPFESHIIKVAERPVHRIYDLIQAAK